MVHETKVHEHFVTEIPDILMSQTPMDGFLIGTFPDGANDCHASFSVR
jgi:hypothetical protein